MDNLFELANAHNLSSSTKRNIQELLEIDNSIYTLNTVQSLLAWDQEILMPKDAVKNRCEQMSLIEKLMHEQKTHPRVPELLHVLDVTESNTMGSDAFPKEIRLWLRAKYREWKVATSMPPALLQEIVKTRVEAHHVWIEARKNNDYSLFAPYLEKTVTLQRDKADCLGYKESRYDALLNEFEVGLTTSQVKKVFDELQKKMLPLYQQAREKSKSVNLKPLQMSVDIQKKIAQDLMQFATFSEDTGRLDVSTHPFSASMGKNDARITTRYIEDQPLSSLFSILHEMGHGLYDLGIADIFKRTVCDEGASFGIHESQSRFLENIIGRSREFWEYMYPKLQSYSNILSDESLDDFMKRVLHIKPEFIRVEADEISYALHIIIRFELEKDIIEDNVSVKDIPDMWNEKMKQYLDISPKNYQEGVLQDVHWAEGLFGYFPSYQIGNLYSGVLWELLQQEHPSYVSDIKMGNYSPTLAWLREKVHKHGASLLPSEILPLSVDPIINYLTQRYIEHQ